MYTGLGNVLTPRKVFTVIALFSVMRLFCYYCLVLSALRISEIWVSLKRIKVNNTIQVCTYAMYVSVSVCLYVCSMYYVCIYV